jgi:DNA-binding MarR family transcriptional regulator
MDGEIDHSRQIILALRRISQAIDTYSSELWRQFGLTAAQLGTLREIEHGSATPGELTARMHVSPASVAGVVKRLESRDLISRIRDSDDRRSFHVRITPKGTDLCRHAPSLLRERFFRELEQLDPWERTQMLSMLQRLAAMMGTETEAEAPLLCGQSATAANKDLDPLSNGMDSDSEE